MKWLLDTNVVSEARKRNGNEKVRNWLASVDASDLYLSVLVVGEIRQGIERLRRHDKKRTDILDAWLGELHKEYAGHILVISPAVADEWGRLNVPDPLPVIDGLMAATAKVHQLTLVTRNVKDLARTGIPLFNPFD